MRIAVFGDIHFPFQHRQAWLFALKILPEINIDLIFGLGDWFDLEQVGKFQVPPNRMMTLQYDIQKTYKELTRLRLMMPNVPIEIILGNHERRYDKFLYSKGPQIAGLKGHSIRGAFQLDDFDIRLHPYEVYQRRIGKLLFVHGDEVGGAVDVARRLYLKVSENVMGGHHHSEDSYIHTVGRGKKTQGGWINSCLRTLRPNWSPFSHWTLGFSIVDFSVGGFFHVEQVLFIKRGRSLWTKIEDVGYWS